MFLLNTKLSFTLLSKRPVITSIKLVGLTIGVAVASLLMIYADQEFSFDRHFKNAERIYRTNTIWKEGNSVNVNPICLRTFYEEAPKSIPEIEKMVQIYRGFNQDIRIEENIFSAKRLLYSDPEFVDIFEPDQISGDIREALNTPGTIVVTDKLANILFGDSTAMGKVVEINEKQYTIKGVIKEFPYNTHFRFDVLVAMTDLDFLARLGGLEFFTYTLFKNNVDHELAITKTNSFYENQLKNRFQNDQWELLSEMEALPRIHLFTKAGYDLSPNGDVSIIISLSLLSLLILVLALTNYINLFLVHSEKRSLEIGIRRASGSGQKRLVSLFFGESLGMTLISFIMALILLHSTSNWIRTSFGLSLDPEIWSDTSFYLKIAGLMILTAFMAGIYPAFYLSRLNPVKAIYSATQEGNRKNRLTRIAVVFQFSITIFLITGIGFLYKQLNYISTQSLGFEPKNVMIVGNLNSSLVGSQEAIRKAIEALPEVEHAGASQGTPASGKSGQLIYKYGGLPESAISIAEERVQPGYFETLGIQFLEGRAFRDGSESDRNCVILNETAAEHLGLEEPLGSQVVLFDGPLEVIGVVKDFHYSSLKNAIGPLVFTYYSSTIFNFMIKPKPGSITQAKDKIIGIMEEFAPQHPVNVSFIDDQIKNRYYREYQMARILLSGSILAIVLSVMGLFAMSLFSIQNHTKEIGIRKVLGGTISEVTFTLIWSMVKWTLIAIPIGALPAYWVMSQWIANFAYKTTLSWWMFIPAGILALLIAVLTVSFQVMAVARRNPVESLRYE